MPRKTAAGRPGEDRVADGFNEAAARCRGKPSARKGSMRTVRRASMRPRPDAAENPREIFAICARRTAASMRPRPDAAENR